MPIQIRTSIVPEPLKESLRKARKRQILISTEFDQVAERSRLTAFTVAGDLNKNQIKSVLNAATNAEAAGVSFAKFKSRLTPETFAGITSPEVVYRNAAQNAYQRARFEQQEKLKAVRPFGQYVTFGDDRVRPNHAILHNRVAALSDSFWDSNMPPNGHQCRCTRRTFSQRQLDNKGLKTQTFEEIKRDAAREQTAAGIPKSKQVAPLADKGWRRTFTLGELGGERPAEVFKNFRRAGFQSTVTPKPVILDPPKIPATIADTTNHKELSDVLKRDQSFQSVKLDTISLETSKVFSETYAGLQKKFKGDSVLAFNALRLKKNVRAHVTRKRISPAATLEVDTGSVKSLDKHRKDILGDIETGWVPAIDKKNADQFLITHEFAHTFYSREHLNFARDRLLLDKIYGPNKEKILAFNIELRKLHRSWKKDIRQAKKDLIGDKITVAQFKKLDKDLRISTYANENLDEFWAEGFAESQLSSNPTKYPKLLGELANKHFKR